MCRFFLLKILFFMEGLFYNEVCFMIAEHQKFEHEILHNKKSKIDNYEWY